MPEIEYWYDALIENHAQIKADASCPWEMSHPSSDLDYSIVPHLDRIISCAPDFAQSENTVMQMEKSGNDKILDRWRMNATNSLNTTKSALSNQIYSNVSTIEVVALLMRHFMLVEGNHAMAEEAYFEYHENGLYTDAKTALMNYEISYYATNLIHGVLGLASGGDTRCEPPDEDPSKEALQRVGDLVREYENDSRVVETRFLADKHEVIQGQILPFAERATDRDWWPVIMGYLSTLPTHEAYFELARNSHLPTFEESLWIKADLLSEGRSIWTDSIFERIHRWGASDGKFWEEKPDWAIRILATGHVDWRFEEIVCKDISVEGD